MWPDHMLGIQTIRKRPENQGREWGGKAEAQHRKNMDIWGLVYLFPCQQKFLGIKGQMVSDSINLNAFVKGSPRVFGD